MSTDLEIREARQEVEKVEQETISEPLVYRLGGETSYFRDLYRVSRDDTAALERLQRHAKQMRDVPPLEVRSDPDAAFERRVNPNQETGRGFEFTPPLWLNQLFATKRRPGQVLQRLAHEFDMPSGVSSINLPRITQGALVNDQTPGAPTDNEDIETAPVKAQSIIYSGESDWSLQSLEQSPTTAHVDWVAFTDMTESLDAELEADFITGKGEAFNEALGLLNISGINEVSYTSGSPSAVNLFPELGKAAAQVGAKRKRPPTAWLMSTSRFFWLAFGEDNSNRPLSIEDYPRSDFPNAGLGSVGVYFDDAISTSLGASKEQDTVIACRPDDFLLWHSPIKTAVMEDVLSGSLQVRFRLYRTTATMLGRYPSGISAVTGTGMKVQEGFK